MATGALGKAYIEVHADTKPFSRELMKDLRVVLKAAQKEADKFGKDFGKRMGDSLSREMRSQGQRAATALAASINKVKITKQISVNVNQSQLKTLQQGLSKLGGGLLGGVSSLGSMLQGLGQQIGNMASQINPTTLAIVALVAILAPGLVGAILLVASALYQLMGLFGLLPAILGTLLAVLLPVVAAFQGMGEAFTAIMEGDPEKIAEALKKLSPAARGVALEFQALMPLFKMLQNVAQETFFYPLQGMLTRLGKTLGGTLVTGFGTVARAAGNFAAKLAYAFSTPGSAKMLSTMFTTAANVINALSDPIVRLVSAFGAMAQRAGPFIERLATVFGGLIDQFAAWIIKSIEDGTFDEWLGNAISMAQIIWDLLKEIGAFFKIIFTEYAEDGEDFLLTLLDYMGQFNEYLKSEDGKQFFDGLYVLAWIFIGALGIAIAFVVKLVEAFGWFVQKYNAFATSAAGRAMGLQPFFFDVTPSGKKHDNFNRREGAKSNAHGGIITKETLSWLGEGDKPEVVIPLTKPGRARQLMAESGLMSMAGAGGDVYVYIGNEQLDGRMYRVASNAMGGQATALAQGPRGDS